MTWIGYRAPGILGETFQNRAERGRFALASFADGLWARREVTGEPIDRLVLMGHSYGSNVAAEALKLVDRPVDAYVAIGSAGLEVGTTADQLNAREFYATHARGDGIAGLGRFVHFRAGGDGRGIYAPRVDPSALDGAQMFTSDKSSGGVAVTMHNLKNPIDWGPFQSLADLDGHTRDQEIGYLDPRSSTVRGLREVLTREAP